MDALSALHTRTSVNLLCEPGPTKQQLENLIKAGLRACDHRSLRPWKYLIIEGEARNALGNLMLQVKTQSDSQPPNADMAAKITAKPLRAPCILVVVASIKHHDKVPEQEQLLSAGASAQMIVTAAHAQGIGAIWRSGSLMFEAAMVAGLGLAKSDKIVGFIYLGTPKATKPLPELNVTDFVQYWPAS